ncbi:MAG: cupin domain-containing protein [Cardiobacteriaceae bacterium]|nr:cupin domain-containing protein [Cardiobacteriaceae bacterium]
MKKLFLLFLGVLIMTVNAQDDKNSADNSAEKNTQELNQAFAKGEINPYSEHFTGTTYLHNMSDGSDALHISIGNVTFEKCARTDWHYHTGGQILLVTAGEGLFQEDGKTAEIISTGDVIKIAPDAKHWHGGGAETMMAHISVMPANPENKTVWLEKVSDEEYEKAVKTAVKHQNNPKLENTAKEGEK